MHAYHKGRPTLYFPASAEELFFLNFIKVKYTWTGNLFQYANLQERPIARQRQLKTSRSNLYLLQSQRTFRLR